MLGPVPASEPGLFQCSASHILFFLCALCVSVVIISLTFLHLHSKVIKSPRLFPCARPAIIFLGFWFFMQILSAGGGGAVAWWAHIGGFLAGLLLILPFRTRATPGDYEIFDVDD